MAAVTLVLIGSCAFAQSPDFDWDWRNQQIIGRNDPSLGNTSRLTETERGELIDAIVLRLQKPMSDAGYDDDRIREIASTTRVRFVDVGEAQPLLLATSMGLEGGCDALSNCPLWIFRRGSKGFVALLNDIAASYTLQSADGAPQLVLMRHVSQKESALMAYRFADRKLTPTACFKALWPAQSADNTQPSDPKLQPCDEQPKWERAPADLKTEAPPSPRQEEPPEPTPATEQSSPKTGEQPAAPEQQPASEKPAEATADQATPQPAPESKPEQPQATSEQPAAPSAEQGQPQAAPDQKAEQPQDSSQPPSSDKQAAPNAEQAQPPDSKAEPQPAAPEQQAPGDQQAAPNADHAPTAPDTKPDETYKPDSSTPNSQQN